MELARLLRRFCAEALLWLLAPAVFLAAYIGRYPVGLDAALPHLRLVVLLAAAVALARIVLFRALPSSGARALSALVVAGAVALMLAYYGLVIAGLESWGRVVSWGLISTYAAQIPELAAALGLPLPAIAAVAASCLLGLAFLAWLYLRRFDWVPHAAQGLPAALVVLLLAGGSTALAIEVQRFAAAPPAHLGEPVSLTFFPAGAAHEFQSHGIDAVRARLLEREEDAARAAYRPAAGARRSNVVLIVVDGLRPDHMGVYGYARDTTPNLSRLGREGRLRRGGPVYAACGESVCGLVSIASSRYLRQFSARPFTLQEVLKRHGYRVHMILGGDHKNFYGLAQFYGEVDSYYDGSHARGGYMNDDRHVLDAIAALPPWDGVPVMIQVHLMSAHVLGKRDPDALRYLPASNYMVPGNRAASVEEARRGGAAVNYYDNGVVQADAVIAGLLETLRSKGYLRDALAVVTADHGEALGEHGRYGHANSVTEGVLRVPLLLITYGRPSGPPIAGAAPASHVDVAPTILEELGLPAPASWTGMPLQRPAARAFVYFQQKSEVGLIDARDAGRRWKFWIDLRTGKERAFDLASDPEETVDRIGEVPPGLRAEWRRRVLHGAVEPARLPDPA